METRVRYIAVGLFALFVLLAGVVFALWVQDSGGTRGHRALLLHFDGPATGLRAGAPVTFNGIRIGEVTRLSFDPQDPRGVIAHLLVSPAAPISRDTVADIDTQGIVGSVQVALRGGSPGEALSWNARRPPVLDARATRSLTQEARDALTEMRAIIADNSEPLKQIVANVDTFSAALARNSERVDSILAGLDKLTGGGGAAATPTIYDLVTPDLPASPARNPVQIAIADPSSLVMYDTQKLLVETAPGALSPAALQWSDAAPKLLQRKIVQSLDAAGLRYASLPMDAPTPDVQLQTEIRAFQIAREPERRARIALAIRLAGADGKIFAARVFEASAPAAADDGAPAAAAMNRAFAALMRDLAPWTAQAIAER